ncbi:MAG: hypothetical protein DBY45_05405 [Clostridiales bacterium]|nr:MAG: hypothetical protein DBY45_05405 [Clostridiales bacterium]
MQIYDTMFSLIPCQRDKSAFEALCKQQSCLLVRLLYHIRKPIGLAGGFPRRSSALAQPDDDKMFSQASEGL